MAKRAPEGFEAFGRPEDVANYRRLVGSRRVRDVLAILKRRGMAEHEVEILLRTVAGIPRDWRDANQDTSERQRRRATLARKLSRLAEEVVTDPELAGLCFGPGQISFNTPPEERVGLTTLADAMREGAAQLEPIKIPLPRPSGGPRQLSADRKSNLQSYALLAIFDLLAPRFSRAPNLETETLASVLLAKTIKPGTLTQLRKGARRSYFRDEK